MTARLKDRPTLRVGDTLTAHGGSLRTVVSVVGDTITYERRSDKTWFTRHAEELYLYFPDWTVGRVLCPKEEIR